MKVFDELTNQEISDLADDQIKHYCDLACAEFGAPLMPSRPVEPEKIEIEGELQLVEIGNWHFAPEDGGKVMAVLASTTIYKRENWDKPYYGKVLTSSDYNYPEMKPATMLTAEQHDRHREALVKYREDKKQHEEDKKAFDDAVKKRGEATNWIYEKLREARADISYRTARVGDFDEYFKLAGGVKETAMRFLLKAHPQLLEEQYGDLVQGLCPGYGTEIEHQTSTPEDNDR